MIPKLIFCDVDGTLIDSTEDVTPTMLQLAQQIRDGKLPFTIASGRSLDQIRRYIDALDIRLPVIINNGAGARCPSGSSGRYDALWDEYFPASLVRDAVRRADSSGFAVFMCYGDYELAYRYNSYIQHEMDAFHRYNRFHMPFDDEWETLAFERVSLTDPCKPDGKADSILPLLEPYQDQIQVLCYDSRHIDVMKAGVSKARGIRRLARHLGVPMEEVMAIGDGANDVEMIEAAGIGVAVGNADERLKEEADYVCQGRNTAGVLEAVLHFCMPERR